MLADANGLGGDDALVAGSTLTVPEVKTSLNDASTFKPYDPGEITGPTTPSLPYMPPPAASCSGIQLIITAVVAAVVMAYAPQLAKFMAKALSATATITTGVFAGATVPTAMAASGIVAVGSSAVARGIASAAGLASFSWRDVAYDGITSAVSAGISEGLKGAGNTATAGKTYKTVDAARNIRELNALGRVIQGVGNYAGGVVANTVIGRDTKFSWSAVAATAVGSYVSAKLGGEPGGLAGGASANGLEGWGQNFVDGAVNASARRVFGLGKQRWGEIALQSFTSTLANEVAQGLMQWQAEKANLASRVAKAFAEGAIQGFTVSMSAQSSDAPIAPDWLAVAGMGSGYGQTPSTTVSWAAQELEASVSDTGSNPVEIATRQYEIELNSPQQEQANLLTSEVMEGQVFLDYSAGRQTVAESSALFLSPDQQAEVDRLSAIRLPELSEFTCPIPGKTDLEPSGPVVGPMPTATGPVSLEAQSIHLRNKQALNREALADRVGNMLAFIPFFERTQNPINANQLVNPLTERPVSYDGWVTAVADVGGLFTLRGVAPTQQTRRLVNGSDIPATTMGSRITELEARWGHLSALERRALLEAKAEEMSERWVRAYQDKLNKQYPDLKAHFYDKHAPDIQSHAIKNRAIDGTHPRSGKAGGRPSDSSQFWSFRVMRDVLNEATTRQARGLSPYNVAGKPHVYGNWKGPTGWGYLKVPRNSPVGTQPKLIKSYSGWEVRFDAKSGSPYTAFPTW